MKFTEITVQMPHWSTLNILKPASVCKCPFIFLFTLNYGQVRIILRQSGDKVMLQGLDPQHCWPASTSTLPFHQDLSASCIDMNRYAMVGSELEEFPGYERMNKRVLFPSARLQTSHVFSYFSWRSTRASVDRALLFLNHVLKCLKSRFSCSHLCMCIDWSPGKCPRGHTGIYWPYSEMANDVNV